MNWNGLAGIVAVVMAVSCGTESTPPVAPTDHAGVLPAAAPVENAGDTGSEKSRPETAKPAAPLNVTASIHPGAADLDVVFDAEGSGVTIKVWGVDGLKVKGAAPIAVGAVRSGQSVKVPVQYEEPATVANLAVSVSGTFGGREQVKVQSFTINPGGPAAKPPTGEIKTDSEGRRVKVMKSP